MSSEQISTINSEVIIRSITDPEKILVVMKDCDLAFQKSIISRDNFPVIYRKITNFAEFFAAFLDYSETKSLGYAAVYVNDYEHRKAFISLICVKPEIQGMHVGSSLLKSCFQLARERGMNVIRLEVLRENHHAINFYQHHGFIIEGPAAENSFFMRKTL